LQYNVLAHKIPVHETTAVCTDFRNQYMELGNMEAYKLDNSRYWVEEIVM
jgi:hypothetical protein